MKLLQTKYLLLIILLIASILRLISLESIPIGFNDDEAAFGYNAYSIINTARDEWGVLLPFPVFESFGDWKLVGYLYLTAASQLIFGASEFATRLPSAIGGILAVFTTYLLTKKLFDEKIALVSALLLAISPWHIVASRNAFESDLLIPLITLAIYFFVKGLKTPKHLYVSAVIFGVSFYIYRSSWLFIPSFLLLVGYLYRDNLKKAKKDIFKAALVLFIISLPLIPTVLSFQGQSRFFQESIIFGVQSSGIVDNVNQRRGVCQESLPKSICPLIYNKYNSYLKNYVGNYFSNLSPETYYVNVVPGGYQAFSIRSLFYLFELPLLIVGLLLLVLKRHHSLKILIPWILLVPLGPSITGVGNPGRLNILMPAPQILSAYGFITAMYLISSVRIRIATAATVSLIVGLSTARLITDMFYFYPQISGQSQRYGYKQLFEYLEKERNNYTVVAVSRKTDDAKQYIHYLFFAKIDPREFHSEDSTRKYRGDDKWRVVERINNVVFYETTPSITELPENSLLVVGNKEVSLPVNPIFTVNYLNGDRAFEVYDVDQINEIRKIYEK